MNDQTRTPPVPDVPPRNSPASKLQAEHQAPVDSDFGWIDMRKFSTLSPLEQLDKLTTDFSALDSYEKGMRAADAGLKASSKKEVAK